MHSMLDENISRTFKISSGNTISYHNRIFDAGTGATSTPVGPLPDSWLAACMADLTSDLQVCLS